MTEQEVRELIKKYNSNQASPEERALLEHWFHIQINKHDFLAENVDFDRLKAEIWTGTLKKSKLPRNNAHYAMAAAILLLISLGTYFYIHTTQHEAGDTTVGLTNHSVDVKPGGNRATLTLADGRVVELDQDKDGIVIHEETLTYADGAEIIASGNPSNMGNRLVTDGLNTITTPKGGQYRVELPDGSSVWLNAASVLKYPSRFDAKERRVTLIGEAYFEIAKAMLSKYKAKPFIVQSPTQDVEVLGTHFNIHAYENEARVVTTLLEGSVNVHARNEDKALKLVPGQQSIVQQGKNTTIAAADLSEVLGWKNGEFIFYDETIEMVMNDISRWYDVDIVYKDPVQNKVIWGSVSKFENISKVLKMIELTGVVHFDLQIQEDSRRVYVMN